MSTRSSGATPSGATVRSMPTWRFLGGACLAAALLVGLTVLAGGYPYRAVGNADPGALVRVGTPLLRLLCDLAATVCVGALTFVTCCTRPGPSGLVSADGYAELRVATWSATVWWVSAAVMVPFSAADATGNPLPEVLEPRGLLGAMQALEGPVAWSLTAGVVLLVAVGCRTALQWHTAVVLLAAAVFALLPPLVTAHGSSDSGHDLAIAAMVVHVPAAAVWIGMLLAVLRHARRRGTVAVALAARYSRLATGCWLVLAASGVVLGLVLVSPGQLLGSGYGLALLAKTIMATVLGVGGWLLRRRALEMLRRAGDNWRSLIRLVTAELVVLLGVLAMSVELTHLPVPDLFNQVLSTDEILLGYGLSGPPTLLRLLTDWRVEVLFGPLSVLLAGGYLLGVWRLRRRGGHWPLRRTVSWVAGCLVLLLATSSGIGRYAAAMFSVHIAGHMLVSMLAPVLLALGGPLTLLRAAAPAAHSTGLPGAREWVDDLRDAWLLRVLTHPAVALALFAGSPFVLYFTGLFDAAVRFHWAHLAITAWFLVVGYLFAWPVVGVDPAPRPLPNLARLGMLLAAMPADIVFGAAIIGTDRVIGNGVAAANMYRALALPWVPDLLADQRVAGILALVIGELVLLVMLAALLARWDAVDDSDHESGLAGYRTMLTEELPSR